MSDSKMKVITHYLERDDATVTDENAVAHIVRTLGWRLEARVRDPSAAAEQGELPSFSPAP